MSCNVIAEVKLPNGKIEKSLLHLALLEHILNRSVANYIYINSLHPLVKAAMSSRYKPNRQGEYRMRDVLHFFNLHNVNDLIGKLEMSKIERRNGLRDSKDNVINFNSAIEALEKAEEINDKYNYISAFVVRHDTRYLVVVNPISTRNHVNPLRVHTATLIWKKLDEILKANNYNFDNLKESFSDILDASVNDFHRHLYSIITLDNLYLSSREMEFLIEFASEHGHSAVTARIKTKYNFNFEDVRNAIVNRTDTGLVAGVLDTAKQMLLLAITPDKLDLIDTTVGNDSVTVDRQALIDEVNKAMAITNKGTNDIRLEKGRSRTLSEITAKALNVTLRKLYRLQREKGTLDKQKEALHLEDTLDSELRNHLFFNGLSNFLLDAKTELSTLTRSLANIVLIPSEIDKAHSIAEWSALYTEAIGSYLEVLTDLVDISKVTIDENLSLKDIDNLRKEAEELKEKLEDLAEQSNRIEEDVAVTLIQEVLGTSYNDNFTVEQIVKMCGLEGALTDYLYSFGKLSDPVAAALGTIVRNAEDIRNDRIREITVRVRNATSKLYDSGSNSRFMYEDAHHIISDIDWVKWKNERGSLLFLLKMQGLSKEEILEEILLWEEATTVEEVVDKKTGRTERVPIYRKDYVGLWKKEPNKYSNTNGLPITTFRDLLTPALSEYYDEMMQIKGEIGTLLPEYLLMQYFPPQVRRDLLEALNTKDPTSWHDAISKWGGAVWQKTKEMVMVTENDTFFTSAANLMPTLSNGAYEFARGDFSGEKFKEIPIFFVNPLSDSKELSKDFSASILALACTAHNYDELSKIIDVVEYVKSYIQRNKGVELKDGKALVETYTGTYLEYSLIQAIKKTTTNHTSLYLIDSMLNKHLYGENMVGNDVWNKNVGNLIAYTSFKGLAGNVFGAIANLMIGQALLALMSLANTMYKIFAKQSCPYFGLTDWLAGLVRLFGNAITAPADLMLRCVEATFKRNTGIQALRSPLVDIMVNDKLSLDFLLSERFDLFNDLYSTSMHSTYKKGFKQLLKLPLFMIYSAGEYAIRYNCMYAMLRNKRLQNSAGKNISMRDAFYVKDVSSTTGELLMLPFLYYNGMQITDDNGNLTLDGEAFMTKFKKDLRWACQSMFGAMNEEDKGIIHRNALGRMAMNFRQWMVENYSTRFRGVHWDMDKGEFVRGYWTSAGHKVVETLTEGEVRDLWATGKRCEAIFEAINNIIGLRGAYTEQWSKATETEKLDLFRTVSGLITWATVFFSTIGIFGCIPINGMYGLAMLFGDDEKEKRKIKRMSFGLKLAFYESIRLINDLQNNSPVGIVTSFELIIKSPIAGISTLDSFLYLILGIKDIKKEKRVKREKVNVYLERAKRILLPFYKDYIRIKNFTSSDVEFNSFNISYTIK